MVKISSFKERPLVSTLERSWRSQIFGLARNYCIGEIYCQGRRTAKTQAVCLELGPLCSILEFPSPPSLSPDPPDQETGLIRDAYTGAVQQSQGKATRGRGWTFSIKLLTFSGLKCAVSLYFSQTLLRNAKFARVCPNCRKFCFKHQRCSEVTQVF